MDVKQETKNIPSIGLGTWKSEPGLVGAAVTTALRVGYRHIDAAACYGNEKEVGEAFAKVFSTTKTSTSVSVPRSDVFVTSKLWNSEHGVNDVEAACRQTLADLKLDYLDLYLIHWPQAFEKVPNTTRGFPRNEDGTMRYDLKTSHEDTWQQMERLVDLGLVKSIGLSNFNTRQIDAVLRIARIKPACLQVEVHPFFAQNHLVEYCRKHSIAVVCYSPLGSGSQLGGHIVPRHPTLMGIGAKYGKTAAQVALAYLLSRGLVVIPKSVKANRIEENFGAASFVLDPEDIAVIAALDNNSRTGWGGPKVQDATTGQLRPRDVSHPYYPFRMVNGKNDPTWF